MTRDQAKPSAADARTTEQPSNTTDEDAPSVIVTEYRVTVRIDMNATVTMELDGPDGTVTVHAEIDARDERGRLTRHVTLDGPRVSTTLLESDLPDWTPSNPDTARSDRALRAAINVQYVHRASAWYALYQRKLPGDDAGASGVPAE